MRATGSFLVLPLVAASAAGAAKRRRAASGAAGRKRGQLFRGGTAATSMSIACRVGWWFRSTRRAREHESFGSPAGSESPVALRPVLADGLPFRETEPCRPLNRQLRKFP